MNIRHEMGAVHMECILGFAVKFMFSWVKYAFFAVIGAIFCLAREKSIYENRVVLSPVPPV